MDRRAHASLWSISTEVCGFCCSQGLNQFATALDAVRGKLVKRWTGFGLSDESITVVEIDCMDNQDSAQKKAAEVLLLVGLTPHSYRRAPLICVKLTMRLSTRAVPDPRP